jgi:hypothetical protein
MTKHVKVTNSQDGTNRDSSLIAVQILDAVPVQKPSCPKSSIVPHFIMCVLVHRSPKDLG